MILYDIKVRDLEFGLRTDETNVFSLEDIISEVREQLERGDFYAIIIQRSGEKK